jgi:hypothetical protein
LAAACVGNSRIARPCTRNTRCISFSAAIKSGTLCYYVCCKESRIR